MAKPALPIVALDESTRDGRFHIVSNGHRLAVARWAKGGWEFSSGEPVPFVPIGYYLAGAA